MTDGSGAEGVFDFGAAIRAEQQVPAQKLSLYIPNMRGKDSPTAKAQEIKDIEAEIEAAMNLMVRINGGVTRLATSKGVWHDPSQGEYRDEMLNDNIEHTAIVYSFIRDPARFRSEIHQIKAFLHIFGSKHNQGEVMVELSGEQVDHIDGQENITAFARAYCVKPPYDIPPE